ncbi:MAG: CAP domain-containing protein [Candidatus Ornithomonoglobus sp.]
MDEFRPQSFGYAHSKAVMEGLKANPDLKEVGIAFARGGSYGIYWAQEFATTK